MSSNQNSTLDKHLDDFRLTHPLDVGSALLDLYKHQSFLTASWGALECITSIVEVDRSQKIIYIEVSQNLDHTRILTSAPSVGFTGQAEGVRVRFDLTGLTPDTLDGLPVLKASFPESLLRFQHRKHFRVRSRQTNPFRCTVTLQNGDPLVFAVHDLSVGGVGVRLKGDAPLGVDIGTEFKNATVVFGDVGLVNVDIQVVAMRKIELVHGVVTHLGFKFTRLSVMDEQLLQRVIFQLQRSNK